MNARWLFVSLGDSPFGRGRGLSIALFAASAIAAASVGGCVRRSVTINTDPQGAQVHLNDKLLGTSPVTTDFTWYGDYDVVIRKDGYETLRTHQRIDTPWFELPGIDFISEALVPWTIHDKHEMSFALAPEKPVDPAELLKNAQQMRERTLFGNE